MPSFTFLSASRPSSLRSDSTEDAEAFLPDLLLSVAFAHTAQASEQKCARGPRELDWKVLPGDTLRIKLPPGYRSGLEPTQCIYA